MPFMFQGKSQRPTSSTVLRELPCSYFCGFR